MVVIVFFLPSRQSDHSNIINRPTANYFQIYTAQYRSIIPDAVEYFSIEYSAASTAILSHMGQYYFSMSIQYEHYATTTTSVSIVHEYASTFPMSSLKSTLKNMGSKKH